jgi:hypothetical protein
MRKQESGELGKHLVCGVAMRARWKMCEQNVPLRRKENE